MAELLVGGAFLSTFLQVAFGRLASKAVVDYFRRKKLDLKLLEKLKITMLSVNKVIDDAEEKETTNRYVKQWLDALKDAVYDAEDVLDVISTLDHTHKLKTTCNRLTVHRLTSKLRPSWNPFDTTIGKELDNVLQRFELLLQQKDVLGLKESHQQNSEFETSTRVQTTSLVEESDVYGRNVDKERITELLLSDNDQSNVSVIAIVGMGGIGKTTLAQLVFNSHEINQLFELNKVWICVSEDYDITKITKTILDKLTSQYSYCSNDLDHFQQKLKETLSGKKFLIVLDDIWNQEDRDWDELRKPLNFCASGSKIIVTTRNTRVASAMRAISTYKLQVLSDEDCWLLFAKHAFENISPNSHSKFEVVGRKLVKKCQGLPLAARVLGGLLRTKVVDKEEWDEVLNNDIWNSSDEASENKILSVLRLSYHYLPSNLKRCFALCSLIPKDYEFEREKIVLLWTAENLLPNSVGKKKRDIGYEYLDDLESRSLIQPSSKGKSHFEMHDLVNDLATAVSGKFYKRCDIGNSFEVGEHTRHFSFMISDKFKESELARLEVVGEAKRLRSLMSLWVDSGWHPRGPDFHSKVLPLKLIRTLVLSKSNMKELPSSIGNLKLLRYLDLSCNDELDQLPESLASLYNLEVLNLSFCSSLTKLPSKMRQLIKLNYLDITGTPRLKEMPLQMGRLKDLDVLTDFVLGKDSGSSIAELKELKYLRGKLRIRGLQNITHLADALVANLKEKSNLEKLTLIWEDFDSDISEDAKIKLENLRPHVNMQKLSIRQYTGTRLPDWSGHYSFVNLVYIKVVGLKHCSDLSPFGQLPSLKSLYINKCDSLVTLVPVELLNEIHHRVGHFAALVRLSITWCPKLELPQHHYFTSIEHFSLEGGSCASLQFFSLSLFPKLKRLRLDRISLESLGVTDEANNINLEYLETIEIENCLNFEYFNVGKWYPEMTYLKLHSCESLKVLPENMCNLFPSLETLRISRCLNIEALPQSGLPSSLKNLEITGCKKLIANRLNWGLQRLLSLSTLYIVEFECDDLLDRFPEEGVLPNSLSSLWIEDVQNLTNLNGKSFQLLTSLETLQIHFCPKLQCLPELPPLSSLIISYCPLLESRCQREQGEDWSNIAHIPNIQFYSYLGN